MFDWFRTAFANWLGVPADGQWSLEWQPPTSGWMILAVVGTIGLFLYVWFIYRMEGRTSRGKKVFCAVLRCLSLLLLLWWVLPRPVLRVEPPPGQKDAYILVLVDSSQSETLADHYLPVVSTDRRGTMTTRDVAIELANLLDVRVDVPPDAKPEEKRAAYERAMAEFRRIDLVNKVLGSPKLKILDDLNKKYQVIWTTFDESLNDKPITEALKAAASAEEAQADLSATQPAVEQPAEKPAEEGPPKYVAVEARGTETDIARAIRQAVKLFRGKTLAAMVLVTDGRSTSGEDVSAAAQYARNQPEPIPIFTVAVGDPSPPRNIRMATPQTNEYALVGDVIALDYEVDVKGFKGRTIQIELEATRSDGFRQQVLPQTKLVDKDTAKITGVFQFTPIEKGDYTLTVRSPVLGEEINPRDNARATSVKVRDEKIKILLVSGGPSWEYRNLKNLFVRDNNVLISCWLQSADAEWYQEGSTGWTLTRLPRSEDDLFKYDVIMLVDPTLISTVGGVRGLELDKPWFKLLKKFVQEHGGGLVLAAGRTYTGETLTRDISTDLLDILPIEPDNNAIARDIAWPDARPSSWPMELTPEGAASAILRLDPEDEQNKRIWRILPGPHWCFPAAQEKLGAQVLMRHGDPREIGADHKQRVLMATQFSGAGRTFYCGTDTTWLWNRVGTRFYVQFWNQVVRFVVRGRLLGGRKFAVAQTDKDEYNLGDTVKIWTVLRLPNDQRPTADTLSMTVREKGNGARERTHHIKLKAEKQKPGSVEPVRYAGEFYPSAEGTYEFEFDGSTELPPDRAVGKKVEVKLPEIEFLVPQMDEALLRRVASESGGPAGLSKFLRLAEITELPARIPTVDTSEQKDPIRATLWDKWQLSFLPFMLILLVEWILRKFWRML